ncbi:hypothetical protein [Microbacterium sp. B19]|uniref:hypothetical protein n=1 Tax=Microbacterium sp. B19 TaxID=96765 RepID=UPI000344F3CE|nr:hypothetical protein [Microbacterium sp. B19]
MDDARHDDAGSGDLRVRDRRRTSPLWFAGIGAIGGFTGLLPWLIAGPFLPLQNLGEAQDPSQPGPFVLLPYSQYTIITIMVLLVVGGALAGVVARARGSRPGWGRPLATLAGLIAVDLVAIVQTTSVTRSVLQERSESVVYLVLLTTVAVLAAVVAWAVCLLVSAAPRAGAGLGLVVGAAAGGSWLAGLLFRPFEYASPFEAVLPVLPYLSPILVGLAIAWTGVSSAGRIATAIVGLGLVWIVPPLTTALASAAGSRVLAHDLPGMADYAVNVFTMASTMPELILPPILTALVVAAAGLLVVGLRRRRRIAGAPTASAAAPR